MLQQLCDPAFHCLRAKVAQQFDAVAVELATMARIRNVLALTPPGRVEHVAAPSNLLSSFG
jgi:hypothetical protein